MTDSALASPAAHHDGILTSLSQLFDRAINGIRVKAIEIPLFQRDYAQGRQSEQARNVRERFVADLCAAVDGGEDLHLDFVFGDVLENGTLYPLDGQQRLTALFLLHCYLNWCQPQNTATVQSWKAFRYATRASARSFCQFVTQSRPDMGELKMSTWLCDQASYLATWKHDPTIQGMLVVLDAFHEHYREQSSERLASAWQRLVDPDSPAIRFLLLPVKAQQLDNTLYVKMNSRGKPLTEFENFKADLEALLLKSPAISAVAVNAFARDIDTCWADLFWHYRGEDDLMDEECMRYLRFLFEVRSWMRGLSVKTSRSDLKALTVLSESLLGIASPHANSDFDWIVQRLNVWLTVRAENVTGAKAIALVFAELFTREVRDATAPLRIFNFRDFGETPVGVDLFHACCAMYGTRPWSLAHTLLLYGVLEGLTQHVPISNLHSRLRLLRNLIEASRSEIRADSTRNNMPALLREVEIIMAGGSLADVKTFNQVQVRNEQAKQALTAAHPTLQEALYRLEDHELLRGGLTAFDLDPAQAIATFATRAREFPILFGHSYSLVSAALLAKNNQGRSHKRGSGHRIAYLGAPRQAGTWEDHWRIRYNEPIHPSSAALMGLLDAMASGQSLQMIIDAFIAAPDTAKDWRYYIAKYEVMRGGALEFAGTYVLAPSTGYGICMPKTDSCDNRSNHHDAYLLALATSAGLQSTHIGNQDWPRCFPGHETNARHLELRRSGLRIQCVADGWALSDIPEDPEIRSAFDSVIGRHPVKGTLCVVPQTAGIDMDDRVRIGAALLRDLVAAGF